MAASLVSGGAVGAGMQEVLGWAIEAVEKGMNFNSVLESSTETLDTLIPLVEQMKQLARDSDRSIEVVAKLENEIQKGKELTEKCSKFRWWRFLSFPVYHDRILERDKKIGRHLSMGVQAQIATDSMETLKNVKKILEILVDEFGGGGKGRRLVLRGVSGVPEMPEFTVGLDEPLRKLKVEVLKKGGVGVCLVTGLGGSGKSTLVKKLCWDVEVKGMSISGFRIFSLHTLTSEFLSYNFRIKYSSKCVCWKDKTKILNA
ncbi:hypothetical protein PIB30_118586 [Stylosanthes scabra]|uniref:RPW8 domain-containing protein n=1 Tax=Stylosanthes scabra TaxID=79078 RepID=A0ABU6XJ15_9FABA|nr:hypothetical protein [Stylosanthes scabra]